jgi:hypothetical protein
MRYIPFQIDIFDAARNAELARERERQAMYRRPDAPPLPAEPEKPAGFSFAWIARLAGRRPATGQG